MRQRTTFFLDAGDGVDPAALSITKDTLTGPKTKAAREDRITLALDEVPSPLRAVLDQCHELHIRWVAPTAQQAIGPLYARLPAGLHVFYTPRRGASTKSHEICRLLHDAFDGIDCVAPDVAFTSLPTERFSHSAAFQYFHPLQNLAGLNQRFRADICTSDDATCRFWTSALQKAVSLDLSFDAISHAVKVTTNSPIESQSLHVQGRPNQRTEVGILALDQPTTLTAEELAVAGHLTVLGQDTKPSGTMFAFPSRHRHSATTFSTSFLEPTGLHPTLQLRIASTKVPSEDAHCSLHAYFTLPRTIFADRYQLADPLFLASKNLTAMRYMSQPVDLEAPDYSMASWGSAMLLELATPASAPATAWTAEVPLHMRYLKPSPGGNAEIQVPSPAVFWACSAEEGTKFPNNPFDKTNLGYDGLFGPRTVFWHVDPQPINGSSQLLHTVRVPVLDTSKAAWVNGGTALAILAGFAYVVWKLLVVYLTTGHKANEDGAKTASSTGKRREESIKKKQ